jgi:hypothetical protein
MTTDKSILAIPIKSKAKRTNQNQKKTEPTSKGQEVISQEKNQPAG